jgi:hypothetical protein
MTEEEKHDKKAKTARANRSKGKRGESLVYHALSTWFGVPQSFSSNAGSGGAIRFGQAGDVNCPIGFPFCIEVKNSEAWRMSDLLVPVRTKNKSVIWQYWEQCCRATDDYNTSLYKIEKDVRHKKGYFKRYPLLIFTKNRDEIYCMSNSHPFIINFIPKNYLRLTLNEGCYYIFLLEDFLNESDSSVMLELHRKDELESC